MVVVDTYIHSATSQDAILTLTLEAKGLKLHYTINFRLQSPQIVHFTFFHNFPTYPIPIRNHSNILKRLCAKVPKIQPAGNRTMLRSIEGISARLKGKQGIV